MKHKLAILIIFLLLFLLLAKPASAELVVFRERTTRAGRPVGPAHCYEFSLNENLSQTTTGKIGPGCHFQVDLFAQGEWETTGRYYDTPPYGWGGNAFYRGYQKKNFSFTCDPPQYRLDSSSLPSFLTLIKEERLAPKGRDPTYPWGRRFRFRLDQSSPRQGSFNLTFSFSSNCTMRRKEEKRQVVNLQPVKGEKRRCGEAIPLEINPRGASLVLPLTITEICGPTATPTSSPTPTPSPTPVPTATPTPMITPTATPTPQPPASCACYLLESDHKNLTAVKRGETLNFLAEAFVDTPQTAKVKEMEFFLYQVEPESLEKIAEVAHSGLITATFARSEEIEGKKIEVYQAQWSYTVKESDPLGLYRLELVINCAWKELGFAHSSVLGEAREYYLKLRERVEETPTPTPTLKPTPAPQRQTGILAFLKRLLNLIGIGQPPAPGQPPKAMVEEPTPTQTIVAPKGKTLKLGTFEPLPPPKGCTELYFRVTE